MKFLDTSFLIDIIRQNVDAEDVLDKLDQEGPHATNTIVVHEFLVGVYGAKNSVKELSSRRKLLQKLFFYPLTCLQQKNLQKLKINSVKRANSSEGLMF